MEASFQLKKVPPCKASLWLWVIDYARRSYRRGTVWLYHTGDVEQSCLGSSVNTYSSTTRSTSAYLSCIYRTGKSCKSKYGSGYNDIAETSAVPLICYGGGGKEAEDRPSQCPPTSRSCQVFTVIDKVASYTSYCSFPTSRHFHMCFGMIEGKRSVPGHWECRFLGRRYVAKFASHCCSRQPSCRNGWISGRDA